MIIKRRKKNVLLHLQMRLTEHLKRSMHMSLCQVWPKTTWQWYKVHFIMWSYIKPNEFLSSSHTELNFRKKTTNSSREKKLWEGLRVVMRTLVFIPLNFNYLKLPNSKTSSLLNWLLFSFCVYVGGLVVGHHTG